MKKEKSRRSVSVIVSLFAYFGFLALVVAFALGFTELFGTKLSVFGVYSLAMEFTSFSVAEIYKYCVIALILVLYLIFAIILFVKIWTGLGALCGLGKKKTEQQVFANTHKLCENFGSAIVYIFDIVILVTLFDKMTINTLSLLALIGGFVLYIIFSFLTFARRQDAKFGGVLADIIRNIFAFAIVALTIYLVVKPCVSANLNSIIDMFSNGVFQSGFINILVYILKYIALPVFIFFIGLNIMSVGNQILFDMDYANSTNKIRGRFVGVLIFSLIYMIADFCIKAFLTKEITFALSVDTLLVFYNMYKITYIPVASLAIAGLILKGIKSKAKIDFMPTTKKGIKRMENAADDGFNAPAYGQPMANPYGNPYQPMMNEYGQPIMQPPMPPQPMVQQPMMQQPMVQPIIQPIYIVPQTMQPMQPGYPQAMQPVQQTYAQPVEQQVAAPVAQIEQQVIQPNIGDDTVKTYGEYPPKKKKK